MTRRLLLPIVLLVAIVLIPFGQVATFQFVNYDDEQYITGNRHIQQGLNAGTVRWAFTTFRNSNWHPVTWLSHAADVALFGLRPGPHHAVNLLLHVANTVLVFFFVLMICGQTAAEASRPPLETSAFPHLEGGRPRPPRVYVSAIPDSPREVGSTVPEKSAAVEPVLYGLCRKDSPHSNSIKITADKKVGATAFATILPAFFIAAIFAVHPLHVESVAWVSERKDLLAGFFGLAALICYIQAAAGAGTIMRSCWYWAALVLFAIGLMSKPMLVTLPFLLLLLDYWPLGRFPTPPGLFHTDNQTAAGASRPPRKMHIFSHLEGGRPRPPRTYVSAIPDSPHEVGSTVGIILEKLPFFLLTIVFIVVTYIAQSGAAVVSRGGLPVGPRLINAVVSYGIYLTQFLWPQGLAPFYPYTADKAIPWAALVASLVALALITMAAWFARRSAPWLLIGWLWFLGMLVPVIGIVQVGEQAHADRYMYLPMIGLLLMVAGTLIEIGWKRDKPVWNIFRLVIPAAAILILLPLTYRQAGYWRDGAALFRHALDVTDNNYLAHSNLGLALQRLNDMVGAITHYRQALAIDPRHVRARNGLAVILATRKQWRDAERLLREALAIEPVDAEVNYNLGNVMLETGRPAEAEPVYRRAIVADPDDLDARYFLGIALARQGRVGEAAATWRALLELEPNHAEARRQLQKAEGMMGK